MFVSSSDFSRLGDPFQPLAIGPERRREKLDYVVPRSLLS
jgi:hypothetical protein